MRRPASRLGDAEWPAEEGRQPGQQAPAHQEVREHVEG
jgi:hypothetical protein